MACWCAARQWETALRAAAAAGRPDLWDTTIEPSLTAAAAAAGAELAARSRALHEAYATLRAARALRAELPLADLLGAADAARLEIALQRARAGVLFAATDAVDGASAAGAEGSGVGALLHSAAISSVAAMAAAAGVGGAAAVANAAVFGGRGGGGGGGGGGGWGAGDDGGSVVTGDGWSDASSVMSTDSRADGVPGGVGGGDGYGGYAHGGVAKTLLSSASAASNVSTASAHGRFSHLAKSSLPATLVSRSGTLRLTANGMTPAEAAARDAVAATRAATRFDKRRGGAMAASGIGGLTPSSFLQAGGAGGGGGGGGSVMSGASGVSLRSVSTAGGGLRGLAALFDGPSGALGGSVYGGAGGDATSVGGRMAAALRHETDGGDGGFDASDRTEALAGSRARSSVKADRDARRRERKASRRRPGSAAEEEACEAALLALLPALSVGVCSLSAAPEASAGESDGSASDGSSSNSGSASSSSGGGCMLETWWRDILDLHRQLALLGKGRERRALEAAAAAYAAALRAVAAAMGRAAEAAAAGAVPVHGRDASVDGDAEAAAPLLTAVEAMPPTRHPRLEGIQLVAAEAARAAGIPLSSLGLAPETLPPILRSLLLGMERGVPSRGAVRLSGDAEEAGEAPPDAVDAATAAEWRELFSAVAPPSDRVAAAVRASAAAAALPTQPQLLAGGGW
jgi:hypothetical protein